MAAQNGCRLSVEKLVMLAHNWPQSVRRVICYLGLSLRLIGAFLRRPAREGAQIIT